jgi:hypothetical protein
MTNVSPIEVHPQRLDDAVGYYFGELSPIERAAFDAHLRDCVACSRAVETARAIFPALP